MIKRPKFSAIISTKDAAEVSDSKPIETFIPHQSFSLSEIMLRFEHGQRLPARPLFNPDSEFTEGSVYMEDFEEAPPDDVHDIVDVQSYYNEHQVHKREFEAKQRKKKDKVKDEPVPGEDETQSPPPDPAA